MNESNENFYGLGIAPRLLNTLFAMQFKTPTSIQQKAIPIALEGKDLVGIAQTGTGKTMAFAIPLVQRLSTQTGNALVLVPTRELALQVQESVEKLARTFSIKLVTLIGGDSIGRQIKALTGSPRIIIATPGRLIDLMERGKVKLNGTSILVLDEADRMLDMGFAPQIEKILRTMPQNRQTLLFSATMPPAIFKIASKYMSFPLQVEVAPSGTLAAQVTHEIFIVNKEDKRELLKRLLRKYRGSVLLFCRTKRGTAKITRAIKEMGYEVAEIHSDRSLGQRKQALEGFRLGRYRVLAATDIAARGIDVTGIELVINYDLPDDTENYVHRTGRTGRAGRPGHAISIVTPDERMSVKSIENLIKTTLPVSTHPEVPSAEYNKPKTVYSIESNRGRIRRRPLRRR